MNEYSNDVIFDGVERTLLVDGDIVVYRPCCVFNDDDQQSKEMIAANIRKNVEELCSAAGCTSYIIYLTTSLNFRDHIVDDYKANRVDKERPVNLKWAKMFVTREMGAEHVEWLEADDLLAINQKQDGSTVIWSLDKDLRQVPGLHLDDNTKKVIEIDEIGLVEKRGKKIYFTGFKGLMFQALTGDTADYIIGCGVRKEHTYKSGDKAGQKYMKRVGIGPAQALKVLDACIQTPLHFKDAVWKEYMNIYGHEKATEEMEKQVNLLYMVEEYNDGVIKQWTYDHRKRMRLMDIVTGETNDTTPD